MFMAKFMFQAKDHSGNPFAVTILSESTGAFSIQMLPWGISFAIISSLLGAFYGSGQQIAAELRKSEQRFRELSIRDDLTGLHNQRHYFKQLKAEIERTNRYGQPLSLLILDLDNFKKYNDTFGHIAGDEILEKAGEILRQSLRITDSAYRYGGEEFAVLLPETTGLEALHFAERIRRTFENIDLTLQKEQNISVTVSIGVAQYESGEELNAFIKRTDNNMYAAKNEGKNRINFS
jgi:diguanylate cyclase (GGDEF)-like protein